jgi:hypothetical protein
MPQSVAERLHELYGFAHAAYEAYGVDDALGVSEAAKQIELMLAEVPRDQLRALLAYAIAEGAFAQHQGDWA